MFGVQLGLPKFLNSSHSHNNLVTSFNPDSQCCLALFRSSAFCSVESRLDAQIQNFFPQIDIRYLRDYCDIKLDDGFRLSIPENHQSCKSHPTIVLAQGCPTFSSRGPHLLNVISLGAATYN